MKKIISWADSWWKISILILGLIGSGGGLYEIAKRVVKAGKQTVFVISDYPKLKEYVEYLEDIIEVQTGADKATMTPIDSVNYATRVRTWSENKVVISSKFTVVGYIYRSTSKNFYVFVPMGRGEKEFFTVWDGSINKYVYFDHGGNYCILYAEHEWHLIQ